MDFPSLLVPWLPSPTVVLATLGAAGLYVRGCQRVTVPWYRRALFWTGLATLYLALHTRLDYYAERQFFLHAAQQTLLHHLGPFLIALAWPGPALSAGWPDGRLREAGFRLIRSRPWQRAMAAFAHPLVNGGLFVGLAWLWLVPAVHFYAMLDVSLYRAMNWSMTVNGLFFWHLVLDPRPAPPARMRPGARVLLLAAVMPPQMLTGALITFATHNIYPLYELCGRSLGGMDSLTDQALGGLILWIPTKMMTALAGVIVLTHWYRAREAPDPARRITAVGRRLTAT